MASASHDLRALRVKLWSQNPRCYWCGVVTSIEYQDPAKLSAADATLDHVYHRGDPRRRVNVPKGEDDVVLACFNCNNRRACAYQNGVRFDPLYLPGKVDWNRKWSDDNAGSLTTCND